MPNVHVGLETKDNARNVMITKITMNQVASYKTSTALQTDRRVNLIYGLNGTGKSTLSDYLYDRSNPLFANCSIEGLNDENVLVYNRKFINDYFFETDDLKGVFTLSKQNKDAEEKIRDAEENIAILDTAKQSKTKEVESQQGELSRLKQIAESKCWEIKTSFCGGDRVLEYCLDGLKGQKEKLYGYISSLPKPAKQPSKTTDQLKNELEAIKGDSAQKHQVLPTILGDDAQVETNSVLEKIIVGNEDSPIADLIKHFNNSDWVKDGLKYLPDKILSAGERCPFCQQVTITETVRENIRNYFDKTYESDLNSLKTLSSNYTTLIAAISDKKNYTANPFVAERNAEFESLYDSVLSLLNGNNLKIADKLKNPSQKVSLGNSSKVIADFNAFINPVNKQIIAHNSRIDNKDSAITDIKKQFWEIMRWNYDQTIAAYQTNELAIGKKIKELQSAITSIESDQRRDRNIIAEQQKLTINIDEAVLNINSGLLELGIDSFRLAKHSDIFYRIVRDNQDGKTFLTLSEGEKMIITFLYFIEQCTGKKDATDTAQKKIVVIDDPISSLSHIYVFNVGQLIKRHFTGKNSKYEQVFVLTHCLYFFYELSFRDPKDRDEHQRSFRIAKSIDGAKIFPMHYEEVQNDYQTYWRVIKEDGQPPALIANCMRNIIEYFFGFIEKSELGAVFNKAELKANRYQAFYRYVNRESHSVSQNIFDIKEFDYQAFKDAFKLVFEANGYIKHYDKMMK
jgi:wobble nucleotide-excising tRNase